MGAYSDYGRTGNADAIPSIGEFYKDDFKIGAAVASHWLFKEDFDRTIQKHITSVTAENDMKPEAVLDREATIKAGSGVRAQLTFKKVAPIMEYARKNNIALRYHTLLWHNQTPRWFFAENWSDDKEAKLADRDTMIKRLQNFISDVMEYVNEKWPGLVYAWDVVNEAIEPDHNAENLFRTKSLWYEILKEDFVFLAFREASKHKADGQELFYNDFNVAMPNKTDAVWNLVKRLKDENVIDGIGFQTHIGLDYPDFGDYERAVMRFSELSLTIQSTEMDIRMPTADEKSQMKLAIRYKEYFGMMKRLKNAGAKIDSITLWGLTDDHSWLMGWNGPSFPLLFDGLLRPKAAFFGAILDESIPEKIEEAKGNEALEAETKAPVQEIGGAAYSGMEILKTPFGDAVYARVPGCWMLKKDIDFTGKSEIAIRFYCICDLDVKVILDDLKNEPTYEIKLSREVKAGESAIALDGKAHGTHDAYFVFTAPSVRILELVIR
ncbi:MAG: endo-1,4-beta-xylanase [Clostridia bacterium]|nr:endo-1,4-beta-xylanase [Clostridia bacterium]